MLSGARGLSYLFVSKKAIKSAIKLLLWRYFQSRRGETNHLPGSINSANRDNNDGDEDDHDEPSNTGGMMLRLRVLQLCELLGV